MAALSAAAATAATAATATATTFSLRSPPISSSSSPLRYPSSSTRLSLSSPTRSFVPTLSLPTARLRPLIYSRPNTSFSIRCSSVLTPELKSALDKVVTSHKILLFMKGTKDFPQCGFSNTVVQILRSCNVPFETIDILENEMMRQGLKEYSNWPTFPQLYIDGEFFGGCDITLEAYNSGELQELLEKAACS